MALPREFNKELAEYIYKCVLLDGDELVFSQLEYRDEARDLDKRERRDAIKAARRRLKIKLKCRHIDNLDIYINIHCLRVVAYKALEANKFTDYARLQDQIRERILEAPEELQETLTANYEY